MAYSAEYVAGYMCVDYVAWQVEVSKHYHVEEHPCEYVEVEADSHVVVEVVDSMVNKDGVEEYKTCGNHKVDNVVVEMGRHLWGNEEASIHYCCYNMSEMDHMALAHTQT